MSAWLRGICDGFEDFSSAFNRIYACRTYQAGIATTHVRHGVWDGESCGGNIGLDTWVKLPQYMFKLEKASTVTLVLSQKERAKYLSISVAVFKHEFVTETPESKRKWSKMTRIQKEDIVSVSTFSPSAMALVDLKLEPGQYVAMPQTLEAGDKSSFCLVARCNNYGFSWFSASDVEWEKDFEKLKAGSGPGDVIAELDLDLSAFGLDNEDGAYAQRGGSKQNDAAAASLDDDVQDFVQFTTHEHIAQLRGGNRAMRDDPLAIAYRRQWYLNDLLMERIDELVKVKRRLKQRVEMLKEGRITNPYRQCVHEEYHSFFNLLLVIHLLA